MTGSDQKYCNPRLYSIPPAAPFLSTLVDALLDGRLIPDFKPDMDPLALSGVTIYVPTRRAVRALQAEFVSRAKPNALLLPRIQALGDIDEQSFLPEQQADQALDIYPVIGNLERQLLLTRMIRRWTKTLNKTSAALFGGEEIIVPSSVSDAAWLANDLASLMDTVATEEADWSLLGDLVPGDHADWWQLTLTFLQIATELWPDLLRSRGSIDMATRRGLLLHRQAEHYRNHGSTGPVIAAGSTGSIPATAALLRAIASMENGAVILPGLDRDMKDDVWQNLDTHKPIKLSAHFRTSHQQAAAPGHPQYGLKKLLENIGVLRGDVEHIGGVNDTSIGFARVREEIVNLSMEPSESTDNWPKIRADLAGEKSLRAFENVSLIEAKGERQEALAIALTMRETLNNKDATAALVTPDRLLARRVSAELKRFGVEVDDSAGLPLKETPQGSLVRLVLSVCLAPADPVALLSLVKHPLASFGLVRTDVRHAAGIIELAAVRGSIASCQPGCYFSRLASARKDIEGAKHVALSQKRLKAEDWQLAEELAQAMDEALLPLFKLASRDGPLLLNKLVRASIDTLDAVANDREKGLDEVYGGEAGAALSAFFRDILVHADDESTNIELTASEWPYLYEALLGSRPVRQRRDIHPRLFIWGPLEARLQQVDRVILGGLNEGTWPAATRNDPFLNRPMKSSLSLEPPERSIGLAAHDFQMMLGMNDVVLARTTRAENAPTVASRWLQRLLTLAGEDAADKMQMRGKKFADWVNIVDSDKGQALEKPAVVIRPEPKPVVRLRPKKLSVTEIETWIRDPYSIYAKHVLMLQPLEPIIRRADARERGTLYHEILEEFVRKWTGPQNVEAVEFLTQVARQYFNESKLPEEILAFWWPRFVEITWPFVNWEAGRVNTVARKLVEQAARIEVGDCGFSISGRADRIDLMKDGSAAIIDYKTGTNPSIAQANSLLSPQLPIEGALLLDGGFDGIESNHVSQLAYVRLRSGGGFKVDTLGPAQRNKDTPEPDDLSCRAWAALEALVLAYQNPDQGYLSRARPFRQGEVSGDYDHLARVLEWSVGDEEGQA